ncbi:MAG: LmeA family phospholipid-binding protein, partial [Gemmatimonadaceae bacterium]
MRFRDWPFVTQAVRGRFGHVDVRMRGLGIAELPVAEVDARLYGVH